MTVSGGVAKRTDLPAGDYVSEGLAIVMPDACFPNMVVGDRAHHPWPYLRREVSHNWYCDRRAPLVGFLDRDEAVLLYNLALQFRGKPAIEIGSWMGWSTCHLALAGLELDAVDPALADPDIAESVRSSLARAGVSDHVRLHAARSPGGVRELARTTGVKWSLFFVDGDHDGRGPERDVRECIEHAAPDALFVFHDLNAPDVAMGLHALWRQGWQVRIYQTMQIMGVAWRGRARPIDHTPDPSIVWSLPPHLARYEVSGMSPADEAERFSIAMAWSDGEIARLQEELTSARTELGQAHAEMASRNAGEGRPDDRARAEPAVGFDGTSEDRQGQESWKVTRPLRRAKSGATSLFRAARRLSANRSTSTVRIPAAVSAALQRARGAVGDRLFRGASTGRLPSPADAGRDDVGAIAASGLFDEAFYLSQNPTAVESGIAAIRHYVVSGAASGLDPHPLFDTSFYLESNPDVLAAGANPLAHYLFSGALENRDPHPLFDTSFYRESNPDVAAAGMNPLVHYVTSGAAEGRAPHPAPAPHRPTAAEILIAGSGLFDPAFYVGQSSAIEASGLDPIRHYVASGAAEGLDPHPLFDTSFYYANNPDVLADGTNALEHYILRGAAENRDPHPLFDTSFHRELNPDVVAAGMNPLAHYIQNGATDSRDPHPLFDNSFYLEQKPHVKELGVNPLVHFLAEGPTPDFDPLSSPPHFPDTGICIVTPDLVGPVKNGGIGTASFHFARVLVEAGHQVSVLFTCDLTECQRRHWRNAYAKMGINFLALADTPPSTRPVNGSTWFFERSWRIFEYLRQAHYSVVHFQDWHANGFWSIKAKRVGLAFDRTTLTVMTHSCTKWINEGMQEFTANPFETAKQVWAESYCIERCDVVLSPSRYMLDWVNANHIAMPPRPRLTPYVWSDGRAATPAGRGPVDNDHLIFFGRLETRKGLHIFAAALRRLQREGGDGLPRIVSFLGKHARVRGRLSEDFLEELRRDLPTVDMRVINHFDYAQAMAYIRETRGLVILPSILDNYPLTVIECIQSGTPFIAAATGGIPEMVDAGVVFDPDPASLAVRLKTRRTIDHALVRHKYAACAAEETWLGLHTELLAGAASAGVPLDQSKPQVPLVSVCIPFFNHPRYLQGLVAAFAGQHYPAFEVIVVNDGSSEEASREFDRVATGSVDRRFRFFTTENQGPGATRNFAVGHASGELLIFFDADNIPKGPDFIRTLVRAHQRSEADCLTCPYDIVSADCLLPADGDVVATYRPIGPCLVAGFFENVLGDTTSIITRSAFTRLGGFPARRESLSTDGDGVRLSGQQRTWEDHEFFLNLCFKGGTLETLPEVTFFYRASPRDGDQQANDFQNYQSLFAQLPAASSADLARIIAAVSGPMLISQLGMRQ